MATKGLFDDKRRKEVRDAIRKNELAKVLKRKLPEPATASSPASITQDVDAADIVETVSPQPNPGQGDALPNDPWKMKERVQTSFLPIRPESNADKVQISLFEAIREGSVTKVQDAIGRGADVNKSNVRIPSHRWGDTIMSGEVTPLEYAKKKGWPQIVALLKRYGAQE